MADVPAAIAGGAGAPAPAPMRHTHPLTVMDESTMQVLRLDKQHRQQHIGALIRLFFMPHPGDAPQAITSLTETADEVSLLTCDAGWWPAYCRLAPHAILTFPLLEQLRRLAGLENF